MELPDLLSKEIFLCPEYSPPPEFTRAKSEIHPEFFQPKTEVMLNRLERYSHLLLGLDPIDSRNRKLGRYFERIIQAGLTALTPSWTVHSNIQLKQPQGVGELDFVLESGTRSTHVEVALKFYLFVPGESLSLANFVGPGLTDRFDLKIRKILSQQLRREVPKDYYPTPASWLERRLWLAGMLFYPWDAYCRKIFPDAKRLTINPEHAKGWWMDIETAQRQAFGSRFFRAPKPLWIIPKGGDIFSYFEYGITELDLNQVDKNFREPVFLSRTTSAGIIQDNGFLVPPNWVLAAQSYRAESRQA